MPRFAQRVGRYLDLEVQDVSYEVYFESAGNPDGIPLVLQHTAGSDGRQWRHLLENERVGRDFQMLAYDLPYHAKSVPPTGIEWWKQEYKLTKSFLLDFVVAFVSELGLENPVYMGSSIGGHLALDLALHHPGLFQAVIGLEAAIKSDPGNIDVLDHPEISNSYKGDLMVGLTSPLAPEALRREVGWCYSQGAPPVFRGDLNYWGADHDLGERASEIDTSKTRVFLLTGEYDAATPPALSEEVAGQIKGASYQTMRGLGHFPMSEDPERFYGYIEPVLGEIVGDRAGVDAAAFVAGCRRRRPDRRPAVRSGVRFEVAPRGLHVYDAWHTYWSEPDGLQTMKRKLTITVEDAGWFPGPSSTRSLAAFRCLLSSRRRSERWRGRTLLR